MPVLTRPSAAVMESFLAGEQAMCAEEGRSTAWLREAAADFDTLVALRSVTRTMWDVPATELWYVDGASYIGTVMIRHALTPQLLREGGNIGYHVVPDQRRRGHATAMLAAACAWCRDLGLTRVLVTCSAANVASRRVIEANAGILDSEDDGVLRFWIACAPATPLPPHLSVGVLFSQRQQQRGPNVAPDQPPSTGHRQGCCRPASLGGRLQHRRAGVVVGEALQQQRRVGVASRSKRCG